MYDSTSIQLRQPLRATLAAKMAAFERLHGHVETLPIYSGERPKQVFSITSPGKPKAASKPSQALRQLDTKRADVRAARKTKAQAKLDTLRQMAGRGTKIQDMADAMGITPSSIMRLLREHNIPRGPKMNLEA